MIFSKIKSIFKKSDLKKNLAALFLSEAISRIINFVVILILARIYSVEEFGILNYVNIISGYFLYIINFGFEIHGIKSIAKNPQELNIVFARITSLKIYSAIICVIIYLFIVMNIPEEEKFTLSVLYIFLFLTLAINPYWIFQATQKMESILKYKTIESVIYISLIIIFLVIWKSLYIVPISLFSAQLVAILFSWKNLKSQLKLKFNFTKNISVDIKGSIPIGLASFFALIYINFDVVLLEYFKSDKDVGVYSASIKIFTVMLIPFQIIFSVFLPKLSEIQFENIGNFRIILKKYLKVLSMYSISVSILTFLFAEIIISLFFGNNYLDSVLPLRIFAINILLVGLSAGFSNPLIAMNYQNKHMYALLTGALLNIFLNIVFIPIYSYKGSAIITIISEFIVMLILMYSFNKHFGLRKIFTKVEVN